MSESSRGLSRRQLLAAAGAAGVAAAGATAAAGSASAAPVAPPFRPRGRLRRRPNFLIIMMDEQRTPPVYESEELKAWRAVNLPAQDFLRRHSVEFTHHHTMSVACQPARTSMYTGQYSSLHGVAQTSGSAKTGVEPDLYWLQPRSVPTLGNWFRAAGYEPLWKGKWHISEVDLFQPGSYNPMPSYTSTGVPDPYLESVYMEAGILEQYGFTGFIGPEPHGSNPLNSGSSGPNGVGRDAVFADWNVKELQRLRKSTKPWLLVSSFVNPHDITLWGNLTVAADLAGSPGSFYLTEQLQGSNVPHNLFTSMYDQSNSEDLSTKPSAQASFVGQYPLGFQPHDNQLPYHRFYYQLQKEVDQHIASVISALTADKGMYRDTIVIYMSDHGEMLGAHGGMFQKWHNAYDETVRVPMIFHNPELFRGHKQTDILTSHADLLPTMLGLAGLDEAKLGRELAKTHTQVRRLVGRDLSGFLLGEVPEARYAADAIYFMTDDNIFKGLNAVSFLGTTYTPVDQPNSVETVIAHLPTGADGAIERWKYSRYWDNPQYWTSPGVQDIQTYVPGLVNQPGERVAVTTVKALNPTTGQVGPAPDEFEMYNVTADPAELTNLAGNPSYSAQQTTLTNLLNAQRTAKRLVPVNQPWANGSAQQFPFQPGAS